MRFAPRYDPRILEAVRALDDRRESIAEVSRRIGAETDRLGPTRPSYVHIRRLVLAERERLDAEQARKEALRAVAADVAEDILLGLKIDAYEVAERIREAGR